ncbi:MAG: cyclic pyranopterin phosphate synthase [Omnitrophica WOR_2 bacterium RIFCSPHIGHO2_01_FULL_48_9]|nr:MAG: cyclic pyranopterin phosphate synthase [Omnitrophica WOR_2 bacterium RIFCSPHIGHO2_02_FULL_48_11]OGX33720.1 MAG: cyclic pyranopterin phosphate synthase [Omnitrophica WOR_2 bacterium RIFCSPHIGHO2_01_FULL_48_9]
MIFDQLNRPIHDLRISVIDRCNFRCRYCMPEEEYSKNYTFLKRTDWLSFAEIIRLTKIFVSLGVSKVRLTGGEPLLRPNLDQLIRSLNEIPGIDDIALTTNGLLLAEQAQKLHAAGLHRLTVSLDTLDEKIFAQMNGGRGEVKHILAAIQAAEKAGFDSVKINTVVQKGVNDHTLLGMVDYFRGTPHVIRFIEYMDVGNCNHWDMTSVVPSAEILQMISRKYPLKELAPHYDGEVAERYTFADGKGEVGFVSSVTQPFCASCSRARISTDGKIFTCLFAGTGTDLRTPLRNGASDDELQNIIVTVWKKREDRYSEERSSFLTSHKNSHKVEMFQIGG